MTATSRELQKLASDALERRLAENDGERRTADQLLVEWAVWSGIGVPSVDVAPNVLARFMPRTAAGMPLSEESVYLAVDRAVARLPFRLARVVNAEYRSRGGQRTKAQRLGVPRVQYVAALMAAQYAVWCQLAALGVVDVDVQK
mgnify:CR=1 FL=1